MDENKIEYVYQNNIKLIELFYNSNFYTDLQKLQNNRTLIKRVINGLYTDPDKTDKKLYSAIKNHYESLDKCVATEIKSQNTSCRLDCIISWKTIYNIHKGQKEWLHDYRIVRSSIASHLFFPRHKDSINQLRGKKLYDRIDYTLFDIMQFYNCTDENYDSLILSDAYNNIKTKNWLKSFYSFKKFVKFFDLQYFVSDDYKNVYDLSSDNHVEIKNLNKIEKPNKLYLNKILSFMNKSKQLT